MADPLSVVVSATPNPNSLKFSTNRVLWQGRAQTVTTAEQALLSPLARQLLATPGVKSLFFLRDFVTVTRDPEAAWEPIAAAVQSILQEQLAGAD